jgi:hypothetical protein
MADLFSHKLFIPSINVNSFPQDSLFLHHLMPSLPNSCNFYLLYFSSYLLLFGAFLERNQRLIVWLINSWWLVSKDYHSFLGLRWQHFQLWWVLFLLYLSIHWFCVCPPQNHLVILWYSILLSTRIYNLFHHPENHQQFI